MAGTAVPNYELKEMIQGIKDEVVPLTRDNKNRLDDIEPMVKNHQVILYGDPTNRADTGIVGSLNKIEEMIANVIGWIKPISLAIILAALTAAAAKVAEIVKIVEALK